MNYIIHDFFYNMGGAEKLVCTIARHFPKMKIITSIMTEDVAKQIPDLIDRVIIIKSNFSFLGRIPNALISFYFNKNFIKNANTVLYSGIYSLIYSKHQTKGKKIYFCHTTPRFIFRGEDEKLRKYRILEKSLFYIPIRIFKYLYFNAANSVDHILTNSNHMKLKIKNQLGLNSKVIYAPIDTKKFKWIDQKNYYFALGRLEKYKRVDQIILAFMKMKDKKLIVGSSGSEYNYLINLAKGHKNIFFTGWLTEKSLSKYVGESLACIYLPADEDFGMAAVESLSAGKPVIGVSEGGIKEIIIHKKNGLLLKKKFDLNDIVRAVNYVNPKIALKWKNNCEKSSLYFSELAFINNIKKYIK